MLSCFGHARAKNNSELSCGLSCVSPVGWDCHLVGFEGIVLLRYVVVGIWTIVSGMWRLGMLEKASVVATSLALAFPSSWMT